VFTARKALSPYIKQIRFVFKGLGCGFDKSNHFRLQRDKNENSFLPMLPIFGLALLYLTVPRIRPLVLLMTKVIVENWYKNTEKESRITRREACPKVMLTNKYIT
jgi:hypothetical protein